MRRKPSKTVQIIVVVIILGFYMCLYIDRLWYDNRWRGYLREGLSKILSGFPVISIVLGVFLIWLWWHSMFKMLDKKPKSSFELLVEKPKSSFEGIGQLYGALCLILWLFAGLGALVYGLLKFFCPLLKITCF